MGEGARDIGFMLEWTLLPERLQGDCAVCYFLRTAGENNEHAERSERKTACLQLVVALFTHARVLQQHFFTVDV